MSDEKAVKLDWFFGGIFSPEAEITHEMLDVAIDHAETYLRVCKPLSWSEWQLLTPKGRAAFAEASRRIETVRNETLAELIALRLLAALESPEAVAS